MTDFDEQMQLTVEKEQWAQTVAKQIANNRKIIGLEQALAGARWASMWIDDFKLLEGQAITALAAIERSYETSKARAVAIERYPSGAPAHRVSAAAIDAFCSAFEADAEAAFRLVAESSNPELNLAFRMLFKLYS